MTNWKRLADMTPEPSLLEAIAFAEREENMLSDEAIKAYITKMRAVHEQPLNYPLRIINAKGFVTHLRTLPDDEAVALAIHAVREGDNQQELLRNRAFTQWIVDMAESGAL
jgi:hypothetical protein